MALPRVSQRRRYGKADGLATLDTRQTPTWRVAAPAVRQGFDLHQSTSSYLNQSLSRWPDGSWQIQNEPRQPPIARHDDRKPFRVTERSFRVPRHPAERDERLQNLAIAWVALQAFLQHHHGF